MATLHDVDMSDLLILMEHFLVFAEGDLLHVACQELCIPIRGHSETRQALDVGNEPIRYSSLAFGYNLLEVLSAESDER